MVANSSLKISIAYQEDGEKTVFKRAVAIWPDAESPASAMGGELAIAVERTLPHPMLVLAEAINCLADFEDASPPQSLVAVDRALIEAARAYVRAARKLES